MIELFKERELPFGQRVSVHLNLHRKNYAITALEGIYKGKVVAYADSLLLEDVDFKIRKSVQERVRKNKVKEVHAWVVGTYCGAGCEKIFTKEAYYNPHLVDAFVDKETNKEIDAAKSLFFVPKHMYYR
jgi:hypothetical protein